MLLPLLRSLLVVLLALAGGTAGAEEREVGFIEAYAPPGAELTLQRGDASVPVRLCARILAGDRIHLTRPNERIVLRLVDRPEPVVVTAARGDYVVEAAVSGRGLLDGAWDSILDALNLLDTPERTRVSASIRGGTDELSVPLLATPQNLVAGRRTFTLAWFPDRLPVSITIRPAKGAPLVSAAKGIGGVWTSPALDLTPGSYAVEIAARDGKPVAGRITVVTPDAAPKPPSELANAGLPENVRAFGQATWLALRDPAWRLEAAQRVDPVARSFAPADRLFWTLAEGGALK